ncbi:hypothetical protein DMB65_06370 [Flavobacterium cheongpyeongense]|jgi:Bacterial protein of unknown function (DUF937)|uniref:DUF937 domain-containing protein n=1 Tax=Flavobacterium cheongpyeongense TaxID=2212651 RepID=A0A2V4BRC9_9FLAO|nr:DUF937 domain-containing protein [Flavobacterium cheongpyeongense]PXY41575.1 hypothetical protein DMB65_06370 [Flavobacterium cheongpyeongense]
MTPNLQIELRRFISSNVISKLNKFYFENDALLIKAIDVSLGTVLMGCYNNFDEKKIEEMTNLIQDSTFFKEVDFAASRILSVDDNYKVEGNEFLEQIFTSKKARITEMISNEVGIKSETAREVLNFSALLIISYLQYSAEVTSSLKLLLEDQKRDILNSIPPGIKIILGFSCYETVEEKNNSRFGRSFFNLFGNI